MKTILMLMRGKSIVNAADVRMLVGRDKVIDEIHRQYGTPPDWRNDEGFISLSKIILGQQVSLTAADAHFAKLNSFLEDSFTPENILRLSDQEMHDCYISRQKARYLRELSKTILAGDLRLDELAGKRENTVRQKLIAIKGIGDWTANIYLMFCLQFKDVFPQGDIAVINTIKELYDVDNTEDVIKISERWKPLRSLGSYFMWHHYLKKRKRDGLF